MLSNVTMPQSHFASRTHYISLWRLLKSWPDDSPLTQLEIHYHRKRNLYVILTHHHYHKEDACLQLLL
jgi:hypothetical protein